MEPNKQAESKPDPTPTTATDTGKPAILPVKEGRVILRNLPFDLKE